MILKTILLSLTGLALLGCSCSPPNENPLMAANKALTQDEVRAALTQSLHQLESLRADTPIVFKGMGKTYRVSPQDATPIINEMIRAIEAALKKSPMTTFGGYAPFASLPDGYLTIGEMTFEYDNKIKNAPFFIHRQAVLYPREQYLKKILSNNKNTSTP